MKVLPPGGGASSWTPGSRHGRLKQRTSDRDVKTKSESLDFYPKDTEIKWCLCFHQEVKPERPFMTRSLSTKLGPKWVKRPKWVGTTLSPEPVLIWGSVTRRRTRIQHDESELTVSNQLRPNMASCRTLEHWAGSQLDQNWIRTRTGGQQKIRKQGWFWLESHKYW